MQSAIHLCMPVEDAYGCAGGARAGAPPPPPLPGKGALGKRPPSQAAPNQSRPSAPDQAAPVAGPTPSKPMVKLFWDKLPDKQVSLTLGLTFQCSQTGCYICAVFRDPWQGTEQNLCLARFVA